MNLIKNDHQKAIGFRQLEASPPNPRLWYPTLPIYTKIELIFESTAPLTKIVRTLQWFSSFTIMNAIDRKIQYEIIFLLC